MRPIRVLIVDDSPEARDGLRSILDSHADIDVVGVAASARDGIAAAETLEPDVVLMDAQTDEMDGVEATQRIKKALARVRVLFLAVHTRDVQPALDAGADCCLMKDSARGELLDAVRDLAPGGQD